MDRENEANKWERRPPRKVKSAYANYVKDNYRILREKLGTRQPQALIRCLAQNWKKLSDEDRQRYISSETADKVRYEQAKIAWATHFRGRIPRMRKRRKPEDAPVRTRNPFVLFKSEMWPKLKEDHKEWTQQQMVKECGRMWRELSEPSKDVYRFDCEQDKIRYAAAISEYRRQIGQLEADRRVRNFEARLAALRQRNEIIREEQQLADSVVR